MHKLFEFIRKVYVLVLFVVLELIAISYYAHSTYYTEARLLTRSNVVAGNVHGFFAGIRHYFGLGRENGELVARITRLEEELLSLRNATQRQEHTPETCTIGPKTKFKVMHASVVSNTANRQQNYIILDCGSEDGVTENMSVLTPTGQMVGHVIDCSGQYAIVMSILNTSFRASGKLEGSDYFGSIYWDGTDPHTVILDELSKYAEPQVGEKVLSTGFSQYFPENVEIGTVESIELNDTKTAYKVRVKLAAELTKVKNVILLMNNDLEEIRSLYNSPKVKQHA